MFLRVVKIAEPRTLLIKEYLELNDYFVRVDCKFYKKLRRRRHKKAKGYQTPSDIDIIATKKGKRPIVAEVKGGLEIKSKKEINELYNNKFKHVDNTKIGWIQLRKFLKTKKFRRIVYCFALKPKKGVAQEELLKYAKKKYKLEIIPLSEVLIDFFDFCYKKGKWTYYSDYPNINLIRLIMEQLTFPDYYAFKGRKLKIYDLLSDQTLYRIKKIMEHNKDFLRDIKKIIK